MKYKYKLLFKYLLICTFAISVIVCIISVSCKNMLINKFSVEHIFPNSSSWDEKIDIDRFGNVIPIIDAINTKRGNRHISNYIKCDKHNFIKYLEDMIPTNENYDNIISHAEKIPKITSNENFINFCEMNENKYLENFIKCLFHM